MDYFAGLEFLLAGENPHDSGAGITKRFDGYFGIQYNHTGNLEFSLDNGVSQKVEGAWAFLTYPGPFFEYHTPVGENRHHVFCCFKGPRVAKYIKHGLFAPDLNKPLIRITRPERFLDTMRMLRRELARPRRAGMPRAVLLLEDLLLQMQQQPPLLGAKSQRLLSPIRQLADAIRQKPHYSFDFEAESRTIGISYPYLRKLFVRFIGVAPHRFHLDWRLRRAADFLLTTDDQISKVSEQCGFDDEFYFSRTFKAQYHVSPLKYRQQFRF